MKGNTYNINIKLMLLSCTIFLLMLADVVALRFSSDSASQFHPVCAAYLSEIHASPIPGASVLFAFLPIIILLLGSDDYIIECRKGLNRIIITRTGRRRYFRSKYIHSFAIPAVIIFISLTANLLASFILFNGSDRMTDCEKYAQPYAVYILFLILASLTAGLCGIMCRGISLLTNHFGSAYLLSMVIWSAMQFSNFSISYMYKPFSTYPPIFTIAGGLKLTAVSAVIGILAYRRRLKSDE